MFTLSPRKLKYFWFWREQRKPLLVLLSPWRCRRAENYGAKAPYIQEKAVYCKTGTNLRRSIVHSEIIVLIKLRIIIPPILDHGCATTLQKSSKRSRVSAVFRDNNQQSFDFAMSSLILPRLSRKTCRLTDYKLQIPKVDSFKNLPASYHVNRLVDVLARKDGGAQAQVAQKCGSCNENNENSVPYRESKNNARKRAGVNS